MIHLQLSEPQQAALEQRGEGLEALTVLAWQGPWLVFPRDQLEDLLSELTEASNAEDAQAELLRAEGQLECARLAARCSRVLGNITSRIIRYSRMANEKQS